MNLQSPTAGKLRFPWGLPIPLLLLLALAGMTMVVGMALQAFPQLRQMIL
jgi:hypothetical protein